MSNLKPLVIVLSRNYSTGLGIIRSLGAAGYTVDLIASTKKRKSSLIISCSKYVRNHVEIQSTKIQGDDGKEIVEVLLEYTNCDKEKIILFPTDDFTASVIDANRSVLEEYFIMPHIVGDHNDTVIAFMDKSRQGRLAKRVGLFTPLEWIICLNTEINIPDDIVFPCFVKSTRSISGSKSEMIKCNNKLELKMHLQNMKSFYGNRSVIVQQYLKIDKEYDISGVCIDQNIIIPAVIEKTKIAQYELGVTISGKMLSNSILGEEENKIREMLKQFHYIGMFDMELSVCENKIYFNEVNFRSGGPSFSYYLNGVNLPDILVKELIGEGHEHKEENVYSYGKSFVYEKVAWEDYIHSYMTKKELKQCIENADFTLIANDMDPRPGKLFYKRIRLSAFKHRIQNVFRERIRWR